METKKEEVMATEEKTKKEKVKAVFGWIGYVASLIVLAYLIFYFVFNLVSPNLTARYMGFKGYVILTESMEPELVPNDFVFITAYDFDDLKEGDIVAFVDPNNNVVVHYFAEWTVNERGDACFRTRPANPEAPMDYWRITKDKFVGIYSGKIPKVGGFLRVVGSPIGLIAIVVIGVSIYLIVHIFKKPTKEKQEEIAQAGVSKENIIEAEAEVVKEEPKPEEEKRESKE
jgi:signal peptidase